MNREVQIYCLKCKNYTGSDDENEEVIMVNNKPRRLLEAICAVCNKKRGRFLNISHLILDVKKIYFINNTRYK